MGRPVKEELPEALARTLKIISQNIKAIRQEKGLNQAELANASGISTTTLNEIESKAQRDIRVSTLVSIAESLDSSIVELFIGPDTLHTSDNEVEQLLQVSKTLKQIIRKKKNK